MIESLADIEALAIRCRSDQSKEYVSEAIRCYRAGAYRAAIVSIWIAVVFDLIDKIRELAVSGDKVARGLELRYETYIEQIEKNNSAGIKSALEFEREILEICRDKLQFFDTQQFIDLVRLREDRHRCAHPSFQRVGVPYYPSAEQARLHIRNGIVHVLSQPPVQGKAALAELKALISSAYFPTEAAKAVSQLDNSGLKNASEALVRGFVDLIVFGFVTKGDALFYKPQALAALNAVFQLYPGKVEDRLQKQLNKVIRDVHDKQFSGAIVLAVRGPSPWTLLEKASKDKVIKFIADGPVSEVLPLLSTLSKVKELQPAVEQRVETLEFDELADAIGSHGLGALAKERALHFLSLVRSWDRANEVFSKTILPIFAHLTTADIEKIIRMPSEGADLPGAHGYKLFVDNVRQAKCLPLSTLDVLLKENRASYLVPQLEPE